MSPWHSSHGHSVKNNTQYFGFYKWRSLSHMAAGGMPLSFFLPGRNYTLDGSKYSLNCVQIWKVRRALHSVCHFLPVVCLLCFCFDGSSVMRTSLLTGGCLLSQWCCCLHGHSCHGGGHLGGLFLVILLTLDCTSSEFERLNVWNLALCKPDALSVWNTWHLCDKTSDLYIYTVHHSITTYSPIIPHYHPLVLSSGYFIAAVVSLIDVHRLWLCNVHHLSPNSISYYYYESAKSITVRRKKGSLCNIQSEILSKMIWEGFLLSKRSALHNCTLYLFCHFTGQAYLEGPV